MTRQYRVRGIEQGKPIPPTVGAGIAIHGLHRLRPETARDAGAGEVSVGSDQVVRVELQNGFVFWTRADDLIRERGRETTARDGGEAWEIDVRPRARGARAADRGWLGLGIKVLEFFGVDLKHTAAKGLATAWENKQLEGREPGLYQCTLDGDFALAPATEPLPGSDGPLLVFIHGTASSCKGSFGKLWEGEAGAAARQALRERYGERVYALEHRSLTESPIRNASALVVSVPKAANVHLVTHSRGGLVGELLCLGERDKTKDVFQEASVRALFAADRTIAEQLGLSPLHPDAEKERDAAYESDRKALLKLVEELDARELKVGRYVRVACPARGTTLASGRLDRWLSVLGYVTSGGFLGEALDFLLAVVKERTDPRTLPGLEAMMPGSALTRLLQHPALVTRSDLSVIAGDVEGDSLWAQIKLLAVDWFYGADHDLVVNTGSMYGGIRREPAGRFQFDQGPKVNHFSYFENEKSIRWLMAGLGRAEGADGGFLALEAAKQEEPRWREAVRRSRSSGTTRPLAVVLPGTMGSALDVRGENVWVSYWALARGGLKRLRIDAPSVESTALLDDFYGPLLEFLSRTHRVEIFPYDWRRSIRDAAVELAERLETWLPAAERANQPVHLVAHSMGGLVVRAMIADGGRGNALWRRIVALPNSRFMMLGTPNQGSYEAMRWLTGLNPTQAKLSLLDLTQGTDEIIDLVRAFPGLLELLPFDPDSKDFSSRALWADLKRQLRARWQPADEDRLRNAAATWSMIRQAAPDPRHMIYVAGCQDATVADYRLADYEDPYLLGRKRLAFIGVAQGDGTVTWKSGLLPDVPCWYVEDTAHDELCRRQRALPAYLDLLMTGKTTRLPSTPPTKTRAAGEPKPFLMPTEPPTDDIPDEHSVRSLGLGPVRPFEAYGEGPAAPVINVGICHGDLAYASHAVMVGHYLGDGIFNAEAALDDRLEHALARRMQLGLYPGKPGTHALFLGATPEGKPSGAVVIGLGQVGELSTTLLQSAVRDALLHYALQLAQSSEMGKGVRSAAISCVLIGSGPGGVTVRESVEAILRGAVTANERLQRSGLDNEVLIDRIELVELYEDVALAAAEALESALADGDLANSLAWPERVLSQGQGGWRRVRSDDTAGWWHRLEIIEEKGRGGLRFIASTDRARAEVTQSLGQLELADGFIRQASRTSRSNNEVAKTLFEMLLPNRLKELAPKQENLVLLVDPLSARYPWELLEDRWSQTGRPPSISAGLVRQLKTPRFRQRPAHASTLSAYVVGNPDLGGWQDFADLPGARQEAAKVIGVLTQHGYRVRACVDEKADMILDGLHKDAWRILHLAGHGEHNMPVDASPGDGGSEVCEEAEQTRPTCLSGMVIGDRAFLTPGDVEQMRWVPELVFINCCHLAKTQASGRGNYGLLAANLGMHFIEMGVKAVVAAGWAVDDEAAGVFAETFYHHMLRGEPFGEAVRAARQDIWTRFPNVNTWGAYQCYGDPAFRLIADGPSGSGRRDGRYHAPAELIADLENHTAWTRMQVREAGDDAQALERMSKGIVAHFDAIPPACREAWLARADVAAAVGFAWGETGSWAEAVEWLDKALRAPEGDCPVRAVEQCANFRVRLSATRWQAMRDQNLGDAAEADRQALIHEIESAVRDLDRIAERAPTRERLSLLGGACKRLAWLQTDAAPRLEALVNMAGYYRRAFEIDKDPNPYPFSNWALAKVLALQLDPAQDGDWRKTLDEACRQMILVARQRNEGKPNFWDAVGEADCALVRLLHRDRITARDAEEEGVRISALYRTAARRGASPREYASVLEHLDFVSEINQAPSRVRHALEAIRRAL